MFRALNDRATGRGGGGGGGGGVGFSLVGNAATKTRGFFAVFLSFCERERERERERESPDERVRREKGNATTKRTHALAAASMHRRLRNASGKRTIIPRFFAR